MSSKKKKKGKKKKKSKKEEQGVRPWVWHCKHDTMEENFHCVCSNGSAADLIIFLTHHILIDQDQDKFAYGMEQKYKMPMGAIFMKVAPEMMENHRKLANQGKLPALHVHYADILNDSQSSNTTFEYCHFHSETSVDYPNIFVDNVNNNPTASTIAKANLQQKWSMSTKNQIMLKDKTKSQLLKLMKYRPKPGKWNCFFNAVSSRNDSLEKIKILCDLLILLGIDIPSFLRKYKAAKDVSLLFSCIDAQNPEALLLLLKLGCSSQINEPDHMGITPLMAVCDFQYGGSKKQLSSRKRQKLLEALLEGGADPTLETMDSAGHESIIQELLSMNAEYGFGEENGLGEDFLRSSFRRTKAPIINAIEARAYDIVKMLMAHGGTVKNLTITDKEHGDIDALVYVEQIMQDERMLDILVNGKDETSKLKVVHKFVCSCDGCSNKGVLRCGNCKMVKYCGKECQIKDWKKHKKVCKEMKAERLRKEKAEAATATKKENTSE